MFPFADNLAVILEEIEILIEKRKDFGALAVFRITIGETKI